MVACPLPEARFDKAFHFYRFVIRFALATPKKKKKTESIAHKKKCPKHLDPRAEPAESSCALMQMACV